MAIAIRSSGTVASSTTNPGSIPVPTAQDGDLIVLIAGNSNVKTPAPVGFGAAINSANQTQSIYAFQKTAVGESGNYSVPWTTSGGREILGVVVLYSTVGGIVHLDTSAAQGNATIDGNHTCPSVTTSYDNGFLLCAFVLNANTGSTPPAGMTELWDYDTLVRFYCMYKTLGAKGATGAQTATSGPTGTSAAITLAFWEETSTGKAGAIYGGNTLDAYISEMTLEGTVKQLPTTVLSDTGETQIPGLSAWVATLKGPWASAIETIFGAEVAGRGSSNTLYDFRSLWGPPSDRVTYAWTAAAFVQDYKTKMNVDGKLDYEATIALSGVPTRS